MPILHDEACRTSIESRLQRLTPQAERRWGIMAIDQMLWHVNAGLETALGRVRPEAEKSPLPRPLMRFLVLNMPWPKNAPSAKSMIAGDRYDFGTERERALALIRDFAARDLAESWPDQPVFGRMRGKDWSRLQARHFDHHLRQFGH